MSNLLNNLAARAAAPVPAIQPRPRARFEPPAPGVAGRPGPDWGELPAGETVQPWPPRTPAAATPVPAPGSAEGTRFPPAAAGFPGAAPAAAAGSGLPAGGYDRQDPAGPVARWEERAAGSRPPAAAAPVRGREEAQARPEADALEAGAAGHGPMPRGAPEPLPGALGSDRRGGSAVPNERAGAGTEPRPAQAAAAGLLRDTPGGSSPPDGLRGEHAAARDALAFARGAAAGRPVAPRDQSRFALRTDMPPAAPPVIQVSIGRIEVRAVAAPAAARPAPAPAAGPRLSLEDYLRGRSEGRR